jgi:hypothetical protein
MRKTILLLTAVGLMLIGSAGLGWAISEVDSDTLLGKDAGHSLPGGDNYDTFIGWRAGYPTTTGMWNTFIKDDAGRYNPTGYSNTFIGRQAGVYNTTGYQNSFVGEHSGYSNTGGYYNTFVGSYAGEDNTDGPCNSFIGFEAGYSTTSGGKNTYIGYQAGHSNSTGNGNVFLGNGAGYSETGSDKLYIDNCYSVGDSCDEPFIYGEFDSRILKVDGSLGVGTLPTYALDVISPPDGYVRIASTDADATTKVGRMVVRHYSNAEEPFYMFGAASTATGNFVAFGGSQNTSNAATQIDFFTAADNTTLTGSARLTIKGSGYIGMGTQTPSYPLHMASGAYVTTGGVWTNASSREYKEQIETLTTGEAVETLEALTPVKFAYKADTSEHHGGFIAEDAPELVTTSDKKGMSPMDVVAVLTEVNQELLKKVAKLEKQQEAVKEQQEINRELMKELAALKAEMKRLKVSSTSAQVVSQE